MNNAASLGETMTCPKCGLVQEERADCKRCGVVFSKYYALYPSTRLTKPGGEDSAAGAGLADHSHKIAISDLQTQIRELNARFAEVEFEKAERNQIRADLKILERQMRQNFEATIERLEQCERRIFDFSILQAQLESPDFSFPRIIERLERLEKKLDSLESANGPHGDLQDEAADASRLLLEAQEQLRVLKGEISEIRQRLEDSRCATAVEEARPALEDDVRAIRSNLEELRRFLGALTVKR